MIEVTEEMEKAVAAKRFNKVREVAPDVAEWLQVMKRECDKAGIPVAVAYAWILEESHAQV